MVQINVDVIFVVDVVVVVVVDAVVVIVVGIQRIRSEKKEKTVRLVSQSCAEQV